MKWQIEHGVQVAYSECGNYQLMKVKNEQYALFKKSDFFGQEAFCNLLRVGSKKDCLTYFEE